MHLPDLQGEGKSSARLQGGGADGTGRGEKRQPELQRNQGIGFNANIGSAERIDGAVAMIMALDRAIRNENPGSVYDGQGILVL